MTPRLGLVGFALVPLMAALGGCSDAKTPASKTASDWQAPAASDGSRPYAIDWACEPKRFDSSADTRIDEQEEYCEWRSVAKSAGEKVCQFTTSFNNQRDFYLNSRGRTGINSVAAAQQLRDDCVAAALKNLKRGKPVGHNCTGGVGRDGGGCVPDRNSDPEICDKVRYMVGQNYLGHLDFAIDQMPVDNTEYSPLPLMRFGLLTGLPKGCAFSQDDHTEVSCSVAPTTSCFSLSGQLRVGIRVLTTSPKPKSSGSAEVTRHAALR